MEEIRINENFGVELTPSGTATIFYDVDGTGKYKLSLKSIKEFKEMSDETLAFTANVYINGKKSGYTGNRGCGGCNDFSLDSISQEREIMAVLNERKKSFDSIISDLACSSLDMKESIRRNRNTWPGYNTYEGKKFLLKEVLKYLKKGGAFWA